MRYAIFLNILKNRDLRHKSFTKGDGKGGGSKIPEKKRHVIYGLINGSLIALTACFVSARTQCGDFGPAMRAI